MQGCGGQGGSRAPQALEGMAAEIHEQLKDVQSLLASWGSGDLASWVRRVQGLEANAHSGMAKINLWIAGGGMGCAPRPPDLTWKLLEVHQNTVTKKKPGLSTDS